MRTLPELRRENPQGMQGKLLVCPDGISRIVVMDSWYWQKLPQFFKQDHHLQSMLEYCLELSQKSVEQEGWEHDTAFRELLMLIIYRHHQVSKQVQNNIANDDFDDLFQHLND